MIRTILVFIHVVLFLVCSIPVMLVELIIGKFNPDLKDRSSLALVKWAFRGIIFLSGTKVIVKGEENIPTDTPVLYVGNHRSYYDIILTYVRVPRITGYVAKLETKKVPLLNVWMSYLHCVFLDRKDIKQGLKTILLAVDKAKSGKSMCIFPEGTRNKTPDTFLPFHDASFKIADRAGIPVVPMTLVGTGEIFEDHLPSIKKSTVVISYGKPFYIKDLEKEQQKKIGEYTKQIISDTYFEIKKEMQA